MKITYLSLTDTEADITLSASDFHDRLTVIVAPNDVTADLLLRFLRETFSEPSRIERTASSLTGQVRLESSIGQVVLEPGRQAVWDTEVSTTTGRSSRRDPRSETGPCGELFAQPAGAVRDPAPGPLAEQLDRLLSATAEPVVEATIAALALHRRELEELIDRLVIRIQQADADLLAAADHPIRAASEHVDLAGLQDELERIDANLPSLKATIDDYSALVEIGDLYEEAAQISRTAPSPLSAGAIDLLLQDNDDDPLSAAKRIVDELDRLDAIVVRAESDLERIAGEQTRRVAAAQLVQRAMASLGPENTLDELERLVRAEQERRKRLPGLEQALQQHQARYAMSSIDLDDLDDSSAGSFNMSFEKSIRLRLEHRELVLGLREELEQATEAIAQHEISSRHLLSARTETSTLSDAAEVERRESVLRLLRPALQALDQRSSDQDATRSITPDQSQPLRPSDHIVMLCERWAQPSLLALSALSIIAAIVLVIAGQSLIAIGFSIGSAALVGLAVAAPGPAIDRASRAPQALRARSSDGNPDRDAASSQDEPGAADRTSEPDLERHVRSLAEQIGIRVPSTAAGLDPYERELESMRADQQKRLAIDEKFQRSELRRKELEDRQVALVDMLEREQSAEAAIDERCAEWLTSLNIDVDTDRERVDGILARLRKARQASEAIGVLEQERRRCAAESVVFNRQMTELWDVAQPGIPAPHDLVAAAQPVHRALQTALRRLEHDADVITADGQVERVAGALSDAASNYGEFVARVGSDDRDKIFAQAHASAEIARVQKQIAEATQLVADRFEPEVLADLAANDQGERWAELHTTLEAALDHEDELLERRSELVEMIREERTVERTAAANAEETVSLRMGGRILATQLEQAMADWRQSVVAAELVDDAAAETERGRRSKVFADAARLFSTISGEICKRITLEGDSLVLEDHHGQVGRLDEVPEPLAELVALAIRLSALSGAAASSTPESLPVVLDDVVATAKPAQAQQLADHIASIATKTQVVVVTTQHATADMLLEAVDADGARTIPLQQLRRGNIREVLAGVSSPAALPPAG